MREIWLGRQDSDPKAKLRRLSGAARIERPARDQKVTLPVDPCQWTDPISLDLARQSGQHLSIVPVGQAEHGEPILKVSLDEVTLCVTQSVYERQGPWGVRHLALELELLPELIRALTFPVDDSLPDQSKQCLGGFLAEYEQYGVDLLLRFVQHAFAVLMQGKPLAAAIKRFELIETGLLQPKRRRPRGRKPKGLTAMSNSERQRNWRDRRRAEAERSREVGHEG